MKEEKHFCDRCKKEISVTYDLSDEWKSKTLELCSHCHSEFERLIKTKDIKKFEMERKYHRWKDVTVILGFFLSIFTILIVAMVAHGICR
jgi:hypothetical protein